MGDFSLENIADDVNDEMLLRYECAAQLEHEGCVESMVLNSYIYPYWINDTHAFWYKKKSRISYNSVDSSTSEYRLVDVDKCTNEIAFDHLLFAKVLEKSVGCEIQADNLPIDLIKLELSPCRILFSAFGKNWLYDESEKKCHISISLPSTYLVSPDGKLAAFVRDYNIWVKDLDSGEDRALTKDGERYYAYGVLPERTNLVSGLKESSWLDGAVLEAKWSPDSSRLLSFRMDEREVSTLPVTSYVPSDGSIRPKTIHTKYALPGDKASVKYQILAIDVKSGISIFADYPAIYDSMFIASVISGNRVWWDANNDFAYFVDMALGQKQAKIVRFDAVSGDARVLFSEESETYLELGLEFERPAYLMHISQTNELIWFSERSGWAHLYLYDLATGELKNPITSGQWLVRDLLHFCPHSRTILILAAGRCIDRDPYYREVCSVHIDTGEIVAIASSNHDYLVCKPDHVHIQAAVLFGQTPTPCSGVSPDGKFLVISRSRVDDPPQTLVIDRDGNKILFVEHADISGLPNHWQWPEPVKLLAADGVTDTYGVIFRPSHFTEKKHYPVINWVHSNAFYAEVPKGSFSSNTPAGYVYTSAAAYAELGFIVVIIDGTGSCYRSKAFHDRSYGAAHTSSNLDDQIAGLLQIKKMYPYIDLDRVGITNHGGSNAPGHGLLDYPNFYKVGVLYSAMDYRLLTRESEIYQGSCDYRDYEPSTLGNLAANLKGKLLIIQGMLDPLFHLSCTLNFVDALVSGNKDFDLLLLPNGGHTWSSNSYGTRRSWDYFVKHLLCENPPQCFRLSNYAEYALEKKRLRTLLPDKSF